MSDCSSTERRQRPAVGRRLVLVLPALAVLAACGKRGALRLPKPGETTDGDQKPEPKAEPKVEPQAQPEVEPAPKAEPKAEP